MYSSSFGNMIESNLKEDERIVEEVRKFYCLYGKGNKRYKEKDWKKNVWFEKDNALSYKEGW